MKRLKRYISLLLTVLLLGGILCIPTFAAGDVMYGIGFVNTNNIRLRSQPNTASGILDVAPINECVVIISKTGNWYRVNYNLQEGYMHASYLNVLTRENAELGYGKVTGNAVNMRSGPSTAHRVVDVAAKGEKLYIIGLNQGWYKVINGNSTCYIRSDYVALTEYPYENQDSPNSPRYFRHGKSIGNQVPGNNSVWDNSGYEEGYWTNESTPSNDPWNSTYNITGQDIVNEARKYLGTPYAYGGASPAGFDCSGLVYFVLNSLGFKANRTPEAQYAHGTYVSKENLRPGDLVFFANTGGSGITHVGIYAGNGQFIHSPNSRSTVSYADLTSGYWANHYYGARRVVSE